jgi:glycyl-tRNA synthetase
MSEKKQSSMMSQEMTKVISLCRRRGFIFQSSEIYGGLESCYDYGPLGVELKNNVKRFWWNAMVRDHENIVGLDAAILMHPQVWEASGHVEHFTDPMVDCKVCKHRFRSDMVEGDKCPDCGGQMTEARQFNLMFKTQMGAMTDEAYEVYLRPETAQGIYVNFLNILNSTRQKVPFGIAQIGKAFRNEITPRNFTFRTREFEQAEMQFFVKPGTDKEWFEYWKEQRMNWYYKLGIRKEKLAFHQHDKDELAHYAADAYDVQYEFAFGWKELEGIHNRTDYDLKKHQEFSKKNLTYFDDQTREKFVPYIIETSAGVDRTILTILTDAYEDQPLEDDVRTVLHLLPAIAPYKAAIFPLVKRDGMPEMARKITDELKKRYMVFYDDGGAVGRRYRRQDEAGTPFCITVDSQSLEDQTVTIRDRDSMQQIRIAADKVAEWLDEKVMV